MKRKMLKKCLAIVLSLTTLVSVAGCSSPATVDEGSSTKESSDTSAKETNQEGTKTNSGDVTTITLYPKDASLQSGVVGGYKGDVFADYGFAVDVWAYSDEKTNAILASGTLPDVMYVTKDNLDIMIESGMVLNLEEHLDQMPNITGNEKLRLALDYMREYNSNGTGKLYAMPTSVGNKVTELGVTKNMVAVNWDYYSGIGKPEFKDQWELIDVMKQMLEAYPTGKDNIPNYGTYLNAGSDTEYWANMTMYYKWFGYEPTNLYYLLETDMVNGTYSSILDKNSKYREGLKWYNTLYREGLMDPDSINNDRATQKAKVDQGYAMVPSGSLQGYAYYQPIFMPDAKVYQESWNSVYGSKNYLVINAKSNNIDAALKFLNMLADPDAYFYIWAGKEGDLWKIEDGAAVLRDEETVMKSASKEDVFFQNGEKVELWNTPWIIDDASYPTSYVDPNGEPRGVRTDRWKEVEEIKYSTEQMNEWRTMTGYDYYVDQAKANNAYVIDSTLDNIINFASLPDDTMKLTLDSLKDVIVNASWQMVYAEDTESFDAIWDQMVKDCEALGAQTVIDWRLEDLDKAKELRDALSK